RSRFVGCKMCRGMGSVKLECALIGLLPPVQVFEQHTYPSVQAFDHLREHPDHYAVDDLGRDRGVPPPAVQFDHLAAQLFSMAIEPTGLRILGHHLSSCPNTTCMTRSHSCSMCSGGTPNSANRHRSDASAPALSPSHPPLRDLLKRSSYQRPSTLRS